MTYDNIRILHLTSADNNILGAEEKEIQIARTAIFLCQEGSVDVIVDQVSYTLHSNSLIVYFPLSTLRINNKSQDCKGTLISGDLEAIQPLLYKISDFNGLFLIRKAPHVELNVRQEHNISTYIAMIEDLISRRAGSIDSQNELTTQVRAIRRQQLELVSSSLMLEVVTCYTKFDPYQPNMNRKEDVLLKFISSLYKNYRKEHEVNFYAEQQNLTSRYFSAIIRHQSGKTPSQWISTAILVEAKKLLKGSSRSIKQISDYLNFPNQSYFGKWFKNLTGIGPLDFKNGKDVKKTGDEEFTNMIRQGKSIAEGGGI